MKKLKFAGFGLMALALGLGVAACGGDDDDDDPSGGVELPKEDNKQEVLTETAQKQKLEEVGREFINKVSASDFQTLWDVVEYANDSYIDNSYYDNDVINDWYEAALKACELKSNGDVVRRLFVASNFTGHFKAGTNGWQRTADSKDLQFTFDDKARRECVLTVTTSGKTTTIHNSEFDSYDYEYDYSSYSYRKYQDEENSYAVPEKIVVTLTRDGSELVSVTANMQVTAGSGNEVSLEQGVALVSLDAKVSGYRVVVDRASFDTRSSADASVTLTKGSETLLTAKVSAAGRLSETTKKDEWDEWTEVELAEGGEGTARVDVLGGKVSVRGTVSSLKTVVDNLDNASDNDDDESKFKRYIDNVNKQIDLGVFYDGGNTRQASLILLAEGEHDRWSSYTYWEAVPAVQFQDNSTYTFEEFFDEKTFSKLIDAFEDLMDDFEDLQN